MLIRQFRKMRVTSGILLSKARNRNVTNDSIPTFGVFYSFFRTYDNDNNEPLRSQTCRVNKKNLRSQNKTRFYFDQPYKCNLKIHLEMQYYYFANKVISSLDISTKKKTPPQINVHHDLNDLKNTLDMQH